MKVLVFDTETTNLPEKNEYNKYFPITKTEKMASYYSIEFYNV